MSSKEAVLSSEQALDDYFSALLSEEQELELIITEPSFRGYVADVRA